MRRPLNGFTLIELMVIIAILASLSVVAMPIYQNYLSTSAATTYVGEFAEFKHAYQTEAVIDRREICDEEYLKQLNFDAEPISALFRSRMTHNAQDGILVEVTAALNQESLAGLRAATMVHDHFAGQNALVGTPLVTSSLVHFQAAMVPCGRSISGGITQAPPGTAVPNPGGGSGGGSVNQPAKPNQPAPVSCALPEIEFQGQCVTPTSCQQGGAYDPADPTRCQSCGPTHDLIGDQCLAKCGPDEVRNGSNQCVTPANCQGGQYNANNPVQCLTCGSGYGLNSAKACVKLANCHSGSRSASSPDQCTRCGNGFTLQGDQCICPSTKVTSTAGQCMPAANCQGGQYNPNNPAQCLTCGSGYGLNSAK
ncbi:MAG: pilin, partial [Pseudomonadales bacterium]